MTAFAAPPRPGKAAQPNVVITQEVLPHGQSLRTYATKQMTVLAKGLPKFELDETKDTTLGGLSAVDVRFTWEGERGPLVQRHLMVAHRDTVYNITLSAPRADAPLMATTFDTFLATVQIAGGALAPMSAPPPPPKPVKW